MEMNNDQKNLAKGFAIGAPIWIVSYTIISWAVFHHPFGESLLAALVSMLGTSFVYLLIFIGSTTPKK